MKLFPRVDAIVTISDECLEILKEEFPIFKDKMICIENITSSVVINNRATEFKPKEYIGVENVLLSVGRLSEQKGFDMAISAASKLKKQQINFKWFIIGSGPLESKLKNQIKKEKVEDYVVLIGTKENPYPYIKNCDLFVQPSRYEGKSVVIDEAKILAKPIVATAYPTVRDQIRNANEGVIVELSVDGIYKGLKEMVFDKTKQKEISNYLENHEYGNQTEIKKYIKLIEGE